MINEQSQTVTVYITPFCAPCEQLKRFLSQHGVVYVVRDLMMDEDAEARLSAAGVHSSPALEVEGNIYAGPELALSRLKSLLGIG